MEKTHHPALRKHASCGSREEIQKALKKPKDKEI